MADLANGRVDVVVAVPAAVPGVRDMEALKVNDLGEYVEELELRLAYVLNQAKTDRIALDTFANIIACFVKLAVEQMGGGELEVMIDRGTVDQMDGANVTVGEVPLTRDVLVRVRERAPHPLWEGQHGQG
jgi:hypothetical protein